MPAKKEEEINVDSIFWSWVSMTITQATRLKNELLKGKRKKEKKKFSTWHMLSAQAKNLLTEYDAVRKQLIICHV